MMADDTALKRARVTIKVIGVGGGGNHVLARMAQSDFIHAQNIEDIELIGINTEAAQLALLENMGITCLQIGEQLTQGRGTGGNAAVGEAAAKADEAKIKNAITGADIVFITGSLGGGTGTGAVPTVAEVAKDLGILTVGVVTLPFAFEGSRKTRLAQQSITAMQGYMDALLAIHNDNLMKMPENRKITLVDAFKVADSVLEQAIRCIAELILKTGVINVDFADVTTIFTQSESSDALLGIGLADDAATAVAAAAKSPLLDKSLKGARGVILNLTGDENMSLYDVDNATKFICEQTDPNVNIILGTVIDEDMKGKVQATIIATDFAGSTAIKAPKLDVPQSKLQKPKGIELSTPSFMQQPKAPQAPHAPEPPQPPKQEKNAGAFAIPAFRLTPNPEEKK
ncbi:MAG: cell division protein FtsZ [Selenomonas sp.]|uniref:cell division protein FtsZ n=1 Tax=Selenomonas sp. TaxID=2053611 RepID=UPI0025E0B4AF|nr:cell division protein FtsZ [Selenomonas sp.]MCI6233078.1 cell division protein FtsZ [Selenomonas sp.]